MTNWEKIGLPPYTPFMSDLRSRVLQFCKQHHLRMNTDLGQHFLIQERVLDEITEAARIEESDTVVEIGPGLGVLTERLLRQAAHVIAIEVDPQLPPLLRSFVNVPTDTLTVIEGNALEVALPKTPYKIVANIPYHITSPLLRHAFLDGPHPPTSLTLLIQREVAEKIVDTKDRGLLTIIVSLFGTPRIVTHVPPSAFVPPPKVDSSVLHIDCFPEPRTDRPTMDRVFQLTKLAFSQKRKMLRNTLGSLPEGTSLMQQANIDPTRRPQTLSIDEWIRLAEIAV